MSGEISRSYEGPQGPEWDEAKQAMDDWIDEQQRPVKLVCPRCNGKKVLYEYGSQRCRTTNLPEVLTQICPTCNGVGHGTSHDREPEPNPDPLEEYLRLGGKWD